MPIEIRELHIKTVVDASGEKKGNATAETGVKASEPGEAGNTDQLIELCVEKILEILKEKTER